LFGLTVKSTKLKQFSTFSKLLRVKQPVDSTKQQQQQTPAFHQTLWIWILQST